RVLRQRCRRTLGILVDPETVRTAPQHRPENARAHSCGRYRCTPPCPRSYRSGFAHEAVVASLMARVTVGTASPSTDGVERSWPWTACGLWSFEGKQADKYSNSAVAAVIYVRCC